MNKQHKENSHQLDIDNKVKLLANQIGGRFRLSRLGTPHIVLTVRNQSYSICYFAKMDNWRLYDNYPSYGESQEKIDFGNDIVQLCSYVKNLKEGK